MHSIQTRPFSQTHSMMQITAQCSLNSWTPAADPSAAAAAAQSLHHFHAELVFLHLGVVAAVVVVVYRRRSFLLSRARYVSRPRASLIRANLRVLSHAVRDEKLAARLCLCAGCVVRLAMARWKVSEAERGIDSLRGLFVGVLLSLENKEVAVFFFYCAFVVGFVRLAWLNIIIEIMRNKYWL